jgi:hypothetical protein
VGRTSVLAAFWTIIAMDLVLLTLRLVFAEKQRWLTFTLAAVLLLGFSVSYFYSLGLLLAPFAIALLVISVIKLGRYRKP